ncbi:MAG: tRNA pseudouridine(55) synthase TruB [Burkholderiaceae bacterium]
MGKPRGDRVDGVLLLDKSGGMTSNLALQKARRLLNAAKAGHTGTLDPMATGLLPLTFGEATKFSADLLDADKAYEATIQFGITTTTGDAEGEVIEERPVAVTGEQLEAAMAQLRGTIDQVPPMYSALKRDGKPLYELARAGIEVERAARTVTIHRFELIEFHGTVARVAVDCSKGTYIRVLAEDLGRLLGCGAHLTALRRTRVGELTLDGAVTLDALTEMPLEERRAPLAPADRLLASLARADLDETLAARLRQGQRLAIECPERGRIRVYGPNQELLGTALVNERGVLAPERLIAS